MDGWPNADKISFPVIHFKLLSSSLEANSILEEYASSLRQRDNGPIFCAMSNNSLSLVIQKCRNLCIELMKIRP